MPDRASPFRRAVDMAGEGRVPRAGVTIGNFEAGPGPDESSSNAAAVRRCADRLERARARPGHARRCGRTDAQRPDPRDQPRRHRGIRPRHARTPAADVVHHPHPVVQPGAQVQRPAAARRARRGRRGRPAPARDRAQRLPCRHPRRRPPPLRRRARDPARRQADVGARQGPAVHHLSLRPRPGAAQCGLLQPLRLATDVDRGAVTRAPPPGRATPRDADGALRTAPWFGLIGLLVAAALLAAVFVQVRQHALLSLSVQNQDDYRELNLNQLEADYLRLREQWHAHELRGDLAALQLRYDIFVSRISLLQTEPAHRLLAAAPEATSVVRSIEEFVRRADVYLGAERRAALSPEASHALLAQLYRKSVV